MRGCFGRFRYSHHVVLTAFVGPRPVGTEVCHRDGNPANNRLGNLRWDTRKANHADAIRHGTKGPGELNPFAKYSDALIRRIRTKASTMPRYGRITTLAEKYEIPYSTMKKIVLGTSRKQG